MDLGRALVSFGLATLAFETSLAGVSLGNPWVAAIAWYACACFLSAGTIYLLDE